MVGYLEVGYPSESEFFVAFGALFDFFLYVPDPVRHFVYDEELVGDCVLGLTVRVVIREKRMIIRTKKMDGLKNI